MKKICLILGLCLALSGCSSGSTESLPGETTVEPSESESLTETVEETTAEEVKALEIGEKGESLYRSSLGTSISVTYGYEVINPNENYAISSAKMNIIIRDESGAILDTVTDYITDVAANDSYWYGGNIGMISGVPSTIEYQLETERYEDQAISKAVHSSSFSFTNVNQVGDIIPKVTGEITNNTENDYSSFFTICVIYRKEGKIVGGLNTSLMNDLAAGSTRVFEASNFGFSDYDSVEVYGHPSII